jgi:hypothetical protein
MTMRSNLFWVGLGTVLLLPNSSLHAAAHRPGTMDEMWKIIQQQQKEIEALKAKVERDEKPAEAQRKETEPARTRAEESPAPQPPGEAKSAVGQLERKTDVLATEVEKLKTALVIPEAKQYKSMYGLGPAASAVYRINRGLSIGGYGEAFYTNVVGDKGSSKDRFDLGRLVMYFGYKFSDRIILNNEIEYEHATTGEGAEEKGEVSVEFSTLDFFLHPAANIRTGLMLMPMGFINEIHEPTFFHGNRRPDVERIIIPSTWRELGIGLFGEPLPGLQYRVYGVNGLSAGGDEGFGSGGIRGGRQSGSNAVAEDFAFTGRIDYSPAFARGLLVGASAYLGDSGQGESFGGRQPDVFTQLYELHAQWHYRGLELRALGAYGHIDDAALLSAAKKETIGKSNYGWYAEAAYDIMPLIWRSATHYLAPFFRYERYDTIAERPDGFSDDGAFDKEVYQGGLSYKPIPNVVIKADYRNVSAKSGKPADEVNLGLGFIY